MLQPSRLQCVGLGCPAPRRGSLASWHSASSLLTTQSAAVAGRSSPPAATLCPGSESLRLAKPWARRSVTLFHSATRFCRLLTKQPENTAPSLCLSEVRNVWVFFFFLPPLRPPPLPNRVLRQLRTMLGASQQQRQMAELLDVHRTIPFLPLAF